MTMDGVDSYGVRPYWYIHWGLFVLGGTAMASQLFKLLPRDAVHKRGLCRRTVAGCLSVTFVYCVETAKDMAIVAMKRE